MNKIRARFDSFVQQSGWPHPYTMLANPKTLAQNGFYYAPVRGANDRCVCFCCGTAVARWTSRSNPRDEHLRYSPNCPHLKGAYSKYCYESKRLASFDNWNLPPDFLAQPKRLAAVGFYHHPRFNGPDRCVCFCCGIALIRWEKHDDPMREHMKHSPNCSFVRGNPTDNVQLPGVSSLNSVESSHNSTSAPSELETLFKDLEKLNVSYEDDVPSYFICSITQDILHDPVVAEDGHSYEKEAILQWLMTHNTSPLTNQVLHSKVLFPNHNLRSQLVEFLQNVLHKYKAISASSSSGAPAPSSQVDMVPVPLDVDEFLSEPNGQGDRLAFSDFGASSSNLSWNDHYTSPQVSQSADGVTAQINGITVALPRSPSNSNLNASSESAASSSHRATISSVESHEGLHSNVSPLSTSSPPYASSSSSSASSSQASPVSEPSPASSSSSSHASNSTSPASAAEKKKGSFRASFRRFFAKN